MKMIAFEDVRRWYSFSFNTQQFILALKIFCDLYKALDIKLTNDNLKNLFTDQTEGQWFTLSAKLPEVRKQVCEYCRGKPFDAPGGRCFFCSHTGETFEHDLQHANELCKLISVLLRKLSNPKKETTAKELQLFTVTMSALENMSVMETHPMSGTLSPYGFSAISKCDPNEAGEAMKRAYQFMTGDKASTKNRANLESDNFFLQCPGNAAGISTEEIYPSGACSFISNNMGGPIQQLTILCGLANLQDQIRQGEKYEK